MTATALIEDLQPGELVIRCADGSLMRTMTVVPRADEPGPDGVGKLMQRLSALKLRRKR
jgi:hypothetical protein